MLELFVKRQVNVNGWHTDIEVNNCNRNRYSDAK